MWITKLPFEDENKPNLQHGQIGVKSVSNEAKSALYETLLELRESQSTIGRVPFDKTDVTWIFQ